MKANKMSQTPSLPFRQKEKRRHFLIWNMRCIETKKNTFKDHEDFDFSLYNATKFKIASFSFIFNSYGA